MDRLLYPSLRSPSERLLGMGFAVASLVLLGSAVPAAAAPPAAAPPGVFQAVGSMTVARQGPSLTLLADGSVLVAGGAGAGAAVASTERFDPQTNQFVAGSPMTVARTGHLAVPLSDGRVLMLGGLDAKNHVLASAEVYDPATRSFTLVGSMSQPRWSGTATPLLDGRVLVVGGMGTPVFGSTLATAELFDPASGTFQKTGSLAGPRAGHAAVRLADGRVAILGGLRDGNHIDQRPVEIYDPTTGAFSPQGEIVTARSSGAIFLVPGDKILLAGGATGSPLTSGPLAGFFLALDSIEIYDPATGRSTITGPMSQPRITGGVSLADGRILVVGGRGGGAAAMATADLIDPVTGQASPPARLVGPRASAATILLPDNRALVVGGIDDTSGRILNSAEVYVP